MTEENKEVVKEEKPLKTIKVDDLLKELYEKLKKAEEVASVLQTELYKTMGTIQCLTQQIRNLEEK